jgi:hypothetical protein
LKKNEGSVNSLKAIIATFCLIISSALYAGPFSLSYSGRVVDIQGKPINGKIDVTIKFFRGNTGAQLINVPKINKTVKTNSGAFQFDIDLSAADYNKVFNGNDVVWVQAYVAELDVWFPKQKFSSVPYALKIPIDGSTLSFDSSGNLKVNSENLNIDNFDLGDLEDSTLKLGTGQGGNSSVHIKAGSSGNYTLVLPTDNGTPGQVLETDGDGNLSWTTSGGANSNAGTLCSAGQYLDGDGSCYAIPADTNSNADTICAAGEYLDGDGVCRNNSYIVANGGGVTSETDPNVTAFAKVALPTCSAGEVLKGDGTTLTCVTDADTADTNTNAFTLCSPGEYLDGNGDCRNDAYIVSNGGAVTSVDWANPGTIGSGTATTGEFTDVTATNSLIISDSESDNVTIIANATSDYSLTLPVDDGAVDQVLKTDGSGVLSWTSAITSESDPSVSGFAKAALPTCSAGEVLKGDGTSLSCVTDTGGTDTNANTLCATGEYLDGDGTCRNNAYIVSNGGAVTSETDPNVTAFAKGALPNCSAGQVLKGDGTSLSCVADADTADTNTNAVTLCAIGEYLDGNGDCRNNAFIVSNGGAVTSETDPNVTAFAKGALPNCSAGQVLKGDGTSLSCVTDSNTADTNANTLCAAGQYLDGSGTCRNNAYIVTNGGAVTSESDPNVTAFAKATLPTCGAGEVLKGDGTSLSCVTDSNTADTNANTLCAAGQYLDGSGTCRNNAYIVTNGGAVTSESDPSVTAFAKATLPTCGAGEVLKGDGTSLSCVTDVDTADTNANTLCAAGQYLDGSGSCRNNAYIVSNGGAVTSESDPNVTAFAKATLPTCGAGEVLKGDGTSLSCVTDADTADTNTNADTLCATGEYLDGDGTCRNDAYIVSNGGGVSLQANGILNLGGLNDSSTSLGGVSLPSLEETRGYIGFNSFYDGTEFLLEPDGTDNGGTLIFGNIYGKLRFATFPSTGSTQQSLTTGTIAAETKMTIDSGGYVGIGELNPAVALDVVGQSKNSFNSETDLNIDFNNGNIQETNAAAGTFVFTNMYDGTGYTVAITNATGGNYTLSASGISSWRCSPGCMGGGTDEVVLTSGKHMVMTILKMGSRAYVSWIDGL